MSAVREVAGDAEKALPATNVQDAKLVRGRRDSRRFSTRIVVPGAIANTDDLSRRHSRTTENDIEEQLEFEYEDNSNGADGSRASSLHLTKTKNIVSFTDDDPGNPYNWSNSYKAIIVTIGIISVMNSTIGSSLPSGDVEAISRHFGVTNELQLILPNSIFLMGYVFGPVFFGPLSENFGRQIVMLGTFAGFTIFTLAIDFAPNFAAFIVFRWFTGVFGSSPISVTGGIYADIYGEHIPRGRAMAAFMTATTFGPLSGPIISGYLSVYGWRSSFWFALILAGVSWVPLAFLPETYGPTILQRRARKLRQENPENDIIAPIELEKTGLWGIVVVVLTRPIRMFFKEAIVLSSSLYLALVYAILYMFFQAYSVIFGDTYGFTYGEQGLAFIPNGIGALTAYGLYFWWDKYLLAAKARNAPWTQKEEYRRLPLACFGGPCFTVGMFWIGLSARPDVHWIVPMLGGIPFGIGFLLLFIALLNYVVDAYEIFAASAVAAASCSRSLVASLLPFAAPTMFKNLGVLWACCLLGFVSLAMCVIPFAFIRYGVQIRAKSKFCQHLKEKKRLLKAEEENRVLRRRNRAEEAEKRRERRELVVH